MNMKLFEDACAVLMHSGKTVFHPMTFTDGMDNLFFEEFGMSGSDVANHLKGNLQGIV